MIPVCARIGVTLEPGRAKSRAHLWQDTMQTLLRTALLATALGLASPAIAQFGDGGGGGGGGSSDGDWAIRTELQNPRTISPGSPLGYDRTYSRGPVWQSPPAHEVAPPRRRSRGPGEAVR